MYTQPFLKHLSERRQLNNLAPSGEVNGRAAEFELLGGALALLYGAHDITEGRALRRTVFLVAAPTRVRREGLKARNKIVHIIVLREGGIVRIRVLKLERCNEVTLKLNNKTTTPITC